MFHEFIVVHHGQQGDFRWVQERGGQWLHWQTCLRQVLFCDEEALSRLSLASEYTVYKNADAYQFCLQVICGLHSPITGETEIYGQFRQLIDDSDFPETHWGRELREILDFLVIDVKQVRQKYLRGLGANSYGSYVRKRVRDCKELHLIGNGILAKEVLPWVKKLDVNIHLHCRSPHKAQSLKEEFSLQVHDLADTPSFGENAALIVAAPLAAAQVQRWAGDDKSFEVVVDLRGDSSDDPMKISATMDNLEEVFANIHKAKKSAASKVAEAQGFIEQLVVDRENTVKYRPFGWDEVCQ